MRLRAHDEGFVAAPPASVYGALGDPASYPGWWPGAEAGDEGRVRLRLGRASVWAEPGGHRDGVGLLLGLPAFDGSLEWYLVPHEDGTIVNAYLEVDLRGGGARAGRRLLRLRGSVRRALVALKRRVEGR